MQEKEEKGSKRGGGRGVTFFKGILNSLSALVDYHPDIIVETPTCGKISLINVCNKLRDKHKSLKSM